MSDLAGNPEDRFSRVEAQMILAWVKYFDFQYQTNQFNRNVCYVTNEPHHKKTNTLHMRKTKAQISFAVTAKLISTFVFATQFVKFLYFLNPKFPASSHLL